MAEKTRAQLLNDLKRKSKGGWEQARNVEPKARGGGGLPPRLKNIVGVCKHWKFAATQKGDPYFTLTCIIKDDAELEGRRATISWFINDSEYNTVDECLEMMANDLALAGVELPDDIDQIPACLDDLCERGVHLLLNTGAERKGGKAPNVFIQGPADGYADEPQQGAGEDAGRESRRAAPATSANGSGGGSKRRAAPAAPTEPDPADDVVAEDDGVVPANDDDAGYVPQLKDEYGYTYKGETQRFTVTKVNEEKGKVQLTQKAKPKKGQKPLVLNNVRFEKLEA